jgi:Tetratricopeptide repeat
VLVTSRRRRRGGGADRGASQRGGVWPDVVGVLNDGDRERALALLLEKVEGAQPEERERVRRLMVGLCHELGQEHPLAVQYRRRLATALYRRANDPGAGA